MEEDAVQVLKFMASNGLIANPKKTAMVIVQDLQPRSIESAQHQRRNHHLSKDTRRSINDDVATLYLKWRSLQEEGPPHISTIAYIA